MRLTPDVIGQTVRLRTGQGDLYAEGVVFSYCEAPTIGIETSDGRRIHWRADLTETAEHGPRERGEG